MDKEIEKAAEEIKILENSYMEGLKNYELLQKDLPDVENIEKQARVNRSRVTHHADIAGGSNGPRAVVVQHRAKLCYRRRTARR